MQCPKRKSLGGAVGETAVSPSGVTAPVETRSSPSPVPSETVRGISRPYLCFKAPMCQNSICGKNRPTPLSPLCSCCCALSFPAMSLSHPFSEFSRTFGIIGILFMLLLVRKQRKETHEPHKLLVEVFTPRK